MSVGLADRKRILIVDDEPMNIDILDALIAREYRSLVAKGGEAALRRAFVTPRPDLILLDVMMPDLDGYEVCRRLKADERTRDIPVIFVTAAADAVNEAQGLALGAVDYISKPISPPVVLARIRTHLILAEMRGDALRQRDFVRQVFGRYMGESLVDLVLAHPASLALGGDLRRTTVMICDLRNFTPMTATCPPESVVGALNGFLGEAIPIIDHHGGVIDNLMGDAVLAVFGSILPREEDPRQAVAAALAIQARLPHLNALHRRLELPEISVGIGIDTGDVIAGNIGSSRHMKYSVIGSVVNMAARLQAMAWGGQVLVSERTRMALGDAARIGGHLRVQLKGFAEPVEVFDITGLTSNP